MGNVDFWLCARWVAPFLLVLEYWSPDIGGIYDIRPALVVFPFVVSFVCYSDISSQMVSSGFLMLCMLGYEEVDFILEIRGEIAEAPKSK